MTVLDINEIKKILPHRYPMLLVDRILEVEPMKRAVGIKNITANEMQFLGHFPNEPITRLFRIDLNFFFLFFYIFLCV